MEKAEYDKLTDQIIASAIEVHRELGPGLLESVYEVCLVKELQKRGLAVEQQVLVPVVYKNEKLQKEFFIDVLVEKEIVVELKAVEILLPVHEVQLITYLKLADKRLGLLLNFNVPVLKDGIRRKVNRLIE
ncbi:MAG: GxxExxY protein [Bacteroidota bacterium]